MEIEQGRLAYTAVRSAESSDYLAEPEGHCRYTYCTNNVRFVARQRAGVVLSVLLLALIIGVVSILAVGGGGSSTDTPLASLPSPPNAAPADITSPSAVAPKTVVPTNTASNSTTPKVFDGWSRVAAGSVEMHGDKKLDLFGTATVLSKNGKVVAGAAEGYPGDEDFEVGYLKVFDVALGNLKGDVLLGKPKESFGVSLALSSNGTILAVGADFEHEFDNDSRGLVRVYQFTAGAWVQLGDDIAAPHSYTGEIAGNRFGQVLSLSSDGRTLAIGDLWDSSSDILRTGKVQVFRYKDTGDWEQVGDDINGQTEFAFLGTGVCLSDDGNTLAVLAIGAATIYRLSGGNWERLGNEIPSENPNDPDTMNFAEVISLSGNGRIIAIGARGSVLTGILAGRVRVFELEGAVWKQKGDTLQEPQANGTLANGDFGCSVSLSQHGLTLVVGAHFATDETNNDNTWDTGSASVFQWIETGWNQQGSTLYGERRGDGFGIAVSISADGTEVAVGSKGNENAGSITVFRTKP